MKELPTRYTELLDIEYPIVQDGMGPFGITHLAAAVSNAGGLGTISSPTASGVAHGTLALRAAVEECASLTDKPFAVNIPVDDSRGDSMSFTAAFIRSVLDARAADPGIPGRLRAITTSAGPPGKYVGMIKDAGMVHQHKVGSTRQAIKAEEQGVDAIFASGFEMGGHTHSKPVHTFVLGPNVTEAVDLPVVISGGVRDGRNLAAIPFN